MKLATYKQENSEPRIGVVVESERSLFDALTLAESAGDIGDRFRSMLALIEAGPEALARLKEWMQTPAPNARRSLADVRLLAPLPKPARLRCFSSYEKHLAQAFEQVFTRRLGRAPFNILKGLGVLKLPKRFYAAPGYYKGNHLSVSGPNDVIEWPSYCEQLDYELELAAVIGKTGRDVPAARAREHVFGYTAFNDFSSRDALMIELGTGPSPGPAKGKDFDTGNAFGPWIVTADEVDDPGALRLTISVNGEKRGEARAGDWYHSLDTMIAYASRGESLRPGEILACGAVGDGSGLESWRFLEPGDQVEIEIDRIGRLTNQIGPRPNEIRPL